MYISQPAISKAIKNLENDLGVVLFYRTLNGTVLTEKGKELFEYVEEAFNNFRAAEKKMNENKNLEKGSLSVGIPSHIASFYLMNKIVKFHKEYSNIDITVVNRPSSELLKLLENNEIDFVIDTMSFKDELDYFNVKNLTTFSHCFVTLKNSNYLEEKEEYSLSDLKDVPLILPVFHSSHRQHLDSLAKEKNVTLQNILSIETSELICSMVKKGLGVGYILYDMVKDDIESGRLKQIKVKESLPEVSLNLIYREKNLTEAPLKFINDYLK
jgi:DNA-binding transcriptional LysR family regulator